MTIGNTVKLIEAEKLLAKHFHFSVWCRCYVWQQESPYMKDTDSAKGTIRQHSLINQMEVY